MTPKKYTIVLIELLLIIIMVYLSNMQEEKVIYVEELNISEHNQMLTNSYPEVYLKIQSYDEDGEINIVMRNDLEEEIYYGQFYEIEVYDNEKGWCQNPLTIGNMFSLEELWLKPGDDWYFQVEEKAIKYGDIKKYRLIKMYTTSSFSLNDKYVVLYFDINNKQF